MELTASTQGTDAKTTKESEDWPELRGKCARINPKSGESSLNSLDSHMLGIGNNFWIIRK